VTALSTLLGACARGPGGKRVEVHKGGNLGMALQWVLGRGVVVPEVPKMLHHPPAGASAPRHGESEFYLTADTMHCDQLLSKY